MILARLAVPIVQAPMAGATSPAMVAAVSEAGGLGSLPLGWLEPRAIAEAIAQVRASTARPFACNLFVDTAPPFDAARTLEARDALRPLREEVGLPEPAGEPQNARIAFADQFEAMLALRPAVFSFTFGIPEPSVLRRARENEIFTIGTAKTVDEALALEAAGVDAICAQGFEAGGHHGPFLSDIGAASIGTLALVADVVASVRVPVIAAGGIGDGRGICAVLALGAAAAQLGSAFLLADESTIPVAYREALQGAHARQTRMTTVFSGRSARGIRNRFIDELAGSPIAAYPDQNALTRDIRAAAASAGRADLLALWAGQAVALARPAATRVTVDRLMREARAAAESTASRFRGFPSREAYAQGSMESSDVAHAHELPAAPEAAADEPSVTAEAHEPPATLAAPRSLGIDPAVAERKRKAQEAWDRVVAAHASGDALEGTVTATVKGGLLVDVDGVRGFLPASQASPGAGIGIETLVKQKLPLKVIDVDAVRKRIVVSHRRAAESQKRAARSTLLRSLAIGQRYQATVVRLVDFGAFVDIGSGVDGLVPMSELAFERVEKVGDLLAVGDTFEASVIRIEEGGRKIALSRKAALPDPWRDHADVVRVGATIEGKVVGKEPRLQVEIAPGIVGAVRESDADPAEYEIGEAIEVSIRNLDRRTRRITLTTLHGAAAAIVSDTRGNTGFATLGEELMSRSKKR